MTNGRRRRQRADIGHRMRPSLVDVDDGSCYPRISSRTGGYESSVASFLVSSASEQASWSTGEDARTVKADNTTTATSHELLKFRLSIEGGNHGRGRSKKSASVSQTKRDLTHFVDHGGDGAAENHHHFNALQHRAHASPRGNRFHAGTRLKDNDKPKKGERHEGGGRSFLRKLVNNRKGFRVARNNTEATVDEDAVSDDSRSSPQRQRFVLPNDDDRRQALSPLTYTTGTSPTVDNYLSTEQQASDGFEVVSHHCHKTMTIVHSSLAQHFGTSTPRRKQRILVDSDLVDADNVDNSSSNSSTFNELLMTDGDLMKKQRQYGTGVIRLTVDSLKEHEEQIGKHNAAAEASNRKKQQRQARRKHPFAFWRRTNCEAISASPTQSVLDHNEKRRIEEKRQAYLQQQRKREFGSVTKEQRNTIFDSLVDNKSRATQSTVSSAASHTTRRCDGCPTTGAMVGTVSFWGD